MPRLPSTVSAAYRGTRPADWVVFTDDKSRRVWCHDRDFGAHVVTSGGQIFEQTEDASEVRLELEWDGRAGPDGRWGWRVSSPYHQRAEAGVVDGRGGYADALAAARRSARTVAKLIRRSVPVQWRPIPEGGCEL